MKYIESVELSPDESETLEEAVMSRHGAVEKPNSDSIKRLRYLVEYRGEDGVEMSVELVPAAVECLSHRINQYDDGMEVPHGLSRLFVDLSDVMTRRQHGTQAEA